MFNVTKRYRTSVTPVTAAILADIIILGVIIIIAIVKLKSRTMLAPAEACAGAAGCVL